MLWIVVKHLWDCLRSVVDTANQAWGKYFQKYSNTNTFHFQENEYINFKSIQIRILFEKYSNTFMNTKPQKYFI